MTEVWLLNGGLRSEELPRAEPPGGVVSLGCQVLLLLSLEKRCFSWPVGIPSRESLATRAKRRYPG